MKRNVMIVDEDLFDKLMRKIDKLSEKVENIGLTSNDGFKEKWYVSDEVCKLINVSKRTLQKMRDNNTLKYRKAGRKIYYKASDIEAYLESINN